MSIMSLISVNNNRDASLFIRILPCLLLFLLLLLGIFGCSKNSTGVEPTSEEEVTFGTIEVEIIASGNDQSPPVFTVSVQGKGSSELNANEKALFDTIEPGSYEVEVINIPSHCSLDNTNPQTAIVNANKTVSITFQIDCSYSLDSLAIPHVDTAVNNFMKQYSIPGVSVAVTKGENLVYAKSYGMANIEDNEEVTISSLFRIASISKPITSVAIMKLVEEVRISLDDKVFGEASILGSEYGTKPYSENLKNVTVGHLLHHTAGGWPNDESDPMFKNSDMGTDEIITWTLDNYTLSNTPGTHYAYSNFGYSLLGRVIEKVTGQTYESFVKSEILQEMGITDMSIAGNTKAQRKPNEVHYYGQGNDAPYFYNISRMDAHGGWIASATDLVKFMVKVDGFTNKSDILKSETIQKMTTPTQLNPNYGAGWAVNSADNWWHIGTLPGSSSILVRTSSGFNWVILCNSRSWDSSSYLGDLDKIMWNAVNNNSTEWPDVDFFE